MVTLSRKKLTVLLLAAMIALAAVGMTLALYMNRTNTEINYFNMKTDGVADGKIIEEGWKENTNDPQNAIPGYSYNKGVYIQNVSEVKDMYIYCALKMEIKKGQEGSSSDLAAGDLEKILKVMTPHHNDTNNWYNATDWERVNTGGIQESEIFVYKHRVAQNQNTNKLFDVINMLSSAKPEDMKAIVDMQGFSIVMSGAVIQGDVDDAITTEIKDSLIGMLTTTP